MRQRLRLLIVSQAAMVFGCSGLACYGPVRSSPPVRPSLAPEPITYVYPEDAPIADVYALEGLLAGYRRQGRVVLVDVWSCSYDVSRDRFGALIDLHAKNRAYGLQCVAAGFDNPGRWTSQIAPFLRSVRCTYPCVIVPPSARSEVIARLSDEWDGQVPAILVFDRDGRLAAELLGDTPFSRVQQVVEDVLAGRHEVAAASRRPPPGRVTARTRALDLNASKTITRVTSRSASLDEVEKMAEAIAARCELAIDWADARVAVLPFTLVGAPGKDASGKALADAVARRLSAKHPQAVVSRDEADAVLAKYKLTPLGVEYDPTTVTGRTGWTHVITGTLRSR